MFVELGCVIRLWSRSLPKWSSRLRLEAYQETLLSTRARSNWFRLRLTVIAMISWVQTNQHRGETAPGFKISCPQNYQECSESWSTLTRDKSDEVEETFLNWLSVFQLRLWQMGWRQTELKLYVLHPESAKLNKVSVRLFRSCGVLMHYIQNIFMSLLFFSVSVTIIS